MTRLLLVLCAACAVASLGCKKRPKRLVGEAEIRALGKSADGYFQMVQTRSCVRAPLGGKVTGTGTADKAIIAVIESRPLDTRGIRHAVGHRDACNPYAPGRRGGVAIPANKLCKLIASRAKPLAPGAEVDALLRGVRFGHDLSRGGSLIVAANLAARCKVLTDAVTARVNAGVLSEADLRRADNWLGQLIATQPSAHTLVKDELYLTLIEQVMPQLKPTTWKPMGGWPGGARPTPPKDDDDMFPVVFKYERDLHGIRWLAIRAELAAAKEVCPVKAPVDKCAKALNDMAEDHEKFVAEVGREDIGEVLRTSDKTDVVRANAVDSLRESVRPDYATSLRDLAAAGKRLEALRSLIAARLKAAAAPGTKLEPGAKPKPGAKLKPSE